MEILIETPVVSTKPWLIKLSLICLFLIVGICIPAWPCGTIFEHCPTDNSGELMVVVGILLLLALTCFLTTLIMDILHKIGKLKLQVLRLYLLRTTFLFLGLIFSILGMVSFVAKFHVSWSFTFSVCSFILSVDISFHSLYECVVKK